MKRGWCSERSAARRRPAALAAAALCALLLMIVPARAGASSCSNSSSTVFGFSDAKVVSDTNVSVCATGRVEVSSTSAQPPGCTGGPCGYVGTEAWQPVGGGDLNITAYRVRGRRQFSAALVLGGVNTVSSAVARTGPNGQTTACSDSNNGQDGGFFSPAVRSGRLVVNLARGASSLFGTRCAGPLAVDFGPRCRETPSPSTLGHGRRFRDVTVTYRAQQLHGSAVAEVGTLADRAQCAPLDACDLSGAITITPGAAVGGSVTVSASTPTSRPRRDLLAALGLSDRGHPAGIGVFGGGEERLRGTVTADMEQDGGCRDATRLAAASVQMQSRAGGLLVSLSPQATQAPDPLRTRCPGPELGQHALALAVVPRDALRRRVLTVALHGNAFADGPYRVTTHSTIVLSLRRGRVVTHSYTVPAPPEP